MGAAEYAIVSILALWVITALVMGIIIAVKNHRISELSFINCNLETELRRHQRKDELTAYRHSLESMDDDKLRAHILSELELGDGSS